MIEIKLKPPKNCGVCNSKICFGDKYICGYPTDVLHGMIDSSAYVVDVDSIPDWCPIVKTLKEAEQMSDKEKELFNKMCDGMEAMFELIGRRNNYEH